MKVVLPDGLVLIGKYENGYVQIGVDVGEFIYHNPYGPSWIWEESDRGPIDESKAQRILEKMEVTIREGVYVSIFFSGMHSLFGRDANRPWDISKIGSTLDLLKEVVRRRLVAENHMPAVIENAIRMGLDPVVCRSLQASYELLC